MEENDYCSQCGQSTARGEAKCSRCGARVRSGVLPAALLLLLLGPWAMIYASSRYYLPAFLQVIDYLNRIFAAAPQFPGLGFLVFFDRLYVFYLFWPLVALTLGSVVYVIIKAKKGRIRPAAGWREGALVIAVGGSVLAATALQFLILHIYFRALPDVVLLLPDHLAFVGERLEAAGDKKGADAFFKRALDTVPGFQEKRKEEMKRLYEAFQTRASKKPKKA